MALASTTSGGGGGSDPWDVSGHYNEADCSGTPVLVIAFPECWSSSMSNDSECTMLDYGVNGSLSEQVPDEYYSVGCATDLASYLDEAFSDQVYLRLDFYNTTNCTNSVSVISNALIVDGLCHASLIVDGTIDDVVISANLATLNANGSVTIRQFGTADCSGGQPSVTTVPRELLVTNECYEQVRAYTNADLGDGETVEDGEDSVAAGGGGSDGAIALAAGSLVGAAVAAVALLLV